MTTFSSAYSKSVGKRISLPSLATCRDASLTIFSISAPTSQLVLLARDSIFTFGSIFLFLI